MNNHLATPLSAELTLGQLAARVPAASRVFHAAGLDYCCGGERSLAEACAEKGLEPQALLQSIDQQLSTEPTWEQRPLAALVAHIIERFHDPLRQELPVLRRMAETVEEKHAEKPACPRGLAAHLAMMYEGMSGHLQKEEQILFPMILGGHGQSAARPIQVMEMEHDELGGKLARTRELTQDLTAPPEACPTWQSLYLRLRELEADLMEHIHLENNVLFTRALCE